MVIQSTSVLLPKARIATPTARMTRSPLPLSRGQLVSFQKLSAARSIPLSRTCRHSMHLVPCALNISRGESGEPGEIWHASLDKIRSLWEKIPGPVKAVPRNMWEKCREPIEAFPWKKACEKFSNHIFSLAFWVVKWLFIPVLIISSLSEITYCGWRNKELIIPFGILAGSVLAGIMKDTAIELSKDSQEGTFPWHLFVIGAFFVVIKFFGPYYPYWGRLFLPHFATGGLWSTLWFVSIWYKSQSKVTKVETTPETTPK